MTGSCTQTPLRPVCGIEFSPPGREFTNTKGDAGNPPLTEMPRVRKDSEVCRSNKRNLDNLCDSEKGLMGTVGAISAILNKEAEATQRQLPDS